MYDFFLGNPTQVYFGAEQRKNLATIINSFGCHILLVYGGGSIKKFGLYEEIVCSLRANNVQVVDFGGVMTNPRDSLVDEGASVCRKQHIEAILAVGGGSVIDCAKAISAAVHCKSKCWDFIVHKAEVKDVLPVIAVPTVSGTGSEMNNSCVISNWGKHEKRGFSHPLLYPRAAFLDPTLCYTVNAFHTACGAADTLAHVLDTSYLVNGSRMEMLCQMMEVICRTVVHYGPVAVKEPENYEARANLLWASSWALNGFLRNGIRQLASCHAIEHDLSARYDIAHGLGIAILLPRWMRYMLNASTAPCYARLGREVFCLSPRLDDETCALHMLEKLEKFLYEELGLPSKLSEVGIENIDFALIAEGICWGGELPGYRKLSTADVGHILEMCQ